MADGLVLDSVDGGLVFGAEKSGCDPVGGELEVLALAVPGVGFGIVGIAEEGVAEQLGELGGLNVAGSGDQRPEFFDVGILVAGECDVRIDDETGTGFVRCFDRQVHGDRVGADRVGGLVVVVVVEGPGLSGGGDFGVDVYEAGDGVVPVIAGQ